MSHRQKQAIIYTIIHVIYPNFVYNFKAVIDNERSTRASLAIKLSFHHSGEMFQYFGHFTVDLRIGKDNA